MREHGASRREVAARKVMGYNARRKGEKKMTLHTATKLDIVRALDELPIENLDTVAKFVEFLQSQLGESARARRSPRLVKLGGLWQGYAFSEEEIRSARREAWAGLGKNFDG